MVSALENLLVNFRGVRVQGTLSTDLLSGVDDKSQVHALAEGLVLPQRGVSARDSFLFVLDGLTDSEQLVFNLVLGCSNSAQRSAGLFDVVTALDVPVRM